MNSQLSAFDLLIWASSSYCRANVRCVFIPFGNWLSEKSIGPAIACVPGRRPKAMNAQAHGMLSTRYLSSCDLHVFTPLTRIFGQSLLSSDPPMSQLGKGLGAP